MTKKSVAILDSDLIVPKEKTLVIDGDFSTENFNVAGFGRDGNVSYTHSRTVVHGTLINNGTIKITGNFYTANNRLDCAYDDNINDATDVTLSSTVISENGKMELSRNGHLTVLYAFLNKESNWVSNYTINTRTGMSISDISIAGVGKP